MRHIIFISDIHVGDGSSKDDFSQDEVLTDLLASWSELDRPELVIVGDGLELLESEQVKNMGVLGFWETVDLLDEQLIDSIVKRHERVFDALRRFPGRISYVVGNHDYYLLRNSKLRDRLGEYLPNVIVMPYYYDEATGILALHGNQFDSINRFKEINGELVPPLGDFIARYMMVNFDEALGSYLPPHLVSDYDNVRPVLDVFNWLQKLSETYESGVDLLKIWIDKFLEMMRHEEARAWMRKHYPALSRLSIVFLNRTGGIKLGELLVRIVMGSRNLRRTDYLKRSAIKIFANPSWLNGRMDGYVGDGQTFDFLEGNLHGIVMGHNHKPHFEVLKVKNELKFYLNCGSWKPVIERRSKNLFQKYFEIFYGITRIETDGEVEIITGSINKLRKSEVF